MRDRISFPGSSLQGRFEIWKQAFTQKQSRNSATGCDVINRWIIVIRNFAKSWPPSGGGGGGGGFKKYKKYILAREN